MSVYKAKFSLVKTETDLTYETYGNAAYHTRFGLGGENQDVSSWGALIISAGLNYTIWKHYEITAAVFWTITPVNRYKELGKLHYAGFPILPRMVKLTG